MSQRANLSVPSNNISVPSNNLSVPSNNLVEYFFFTMSPPGFRKSIMLGPYVIFGTLFETFRNHFVDISEHKNQCFSYAPTAAILVFKMEATES